MVGNYLFKQCSSQLAPAFESERGITISSSHVEYVDVGTSGHIDHGSYSNLVRPYLLAVPVMFYRRIED